MNLKQIILTYRFCLALCKLYLIWIDNKERSPQEKLKEGAIIMGAIITILEFFGLEDNDFIFTIDTIINFNDDKELVCTILEKYKKKIRK